MRGEPTNAVFVVLSKTNATVRTTNDRHQSINCKTPSAQAVIITSSLYWYCRPRVHDLDPVYYLLNSRSDLVEDGTPFSGHD